MHQGVDVVGPERQCLGEVVDRRRIVAAPRVGDDAAIEVRGDVLGIELDRLGVVGKRLVGLLERVMGEAALEVGEGIAGIEPDGLIEVLDCALVLLANEIDAAARHEGA